ncbi:MAG: DUF937 domain-containing protein [Bryobacteraceae bacterium]
MNLLESILNAQGGGVVQQLGGQFGLSQGQTESALGALLPALAGAVSQNVQGGGIDSLLGALSGGNHGRYLEDPSLLNQKSTVEDGNGILGHLLGGKEVSRELASRASAQTGIGSDVLKQMLPLAASLLMGGLSQGAQRQSLGASAGAGGGLMGALGGMLGGGQASAAPAQAGILGMLTPLLDQNQDGSALDDILGMATRFLRK